MSEDVTAVTRRHSGTNKLLATLLGLSTAICPAVAGYYAYREARIEREGENRGIRHEADVGYRTLATPLELALALGKSCDARVTALEAQVRELRARQSMSSALSASSVSSGSTAMAPSLGLVPLDRAMLMRPLPRTLGEAVRAK